ncbi:MAG TPA: lysylphosphatidylglycerol synthase transmembrane domain-containing protein [Gemmatimonadales bacterium]|nr:lysylphosphatidylglycerol synthase transmembrane domain-containing protein [Gemmatimonadales bacterium]
MSRKLQLLLFVCGGAVFAYLVSRIGVGRLVADAARTGWVFLPILLLYGVVYVCNAWAWWLTMAGEPSRPPFWRTYAITVSGFALNFMTPMVNVGGEPFKIAAVAPWLGMRRAAGSVVIYQMLHTLGMLLSLLTAVVLGAVFLPSRAVVLGPLTAAFAVLFTLVLLLLTGHRRGVLEHALNLLHRIPLLDRLARRLEPKRATLALMDEQITQFYHRDPRRFYQAVALEYLSRGVFMVEYLLIALSVGLHVGYLKAYVIGGLTQLVQNVTFFVPFEVGTKEGALYLLFQLLRLDPALGVYTAIVSRLRDLCWIGVGVGLVWLSGRRAAAQRVAAP